MKSDCTIDFSEPTTRQELLDSLSSMHALATRFWDGLPLEYFFTPFREKWSPAENVLHLNKSTRPVALALRLPMIVPRLLFGSSNEPSRSYSQILLAYHEALSKGGQAGSYAPIRREFPPDPQEVRDKIMRHWNQTWQQLIRAANHWDDQSLDRLCLPHPLLGKLSIREMLYFTLYHHLHHLQIVAARISDGNSMQAETKLQSG